MGIAQYILKDSYLKIGDEVHKTLQYANVGMVRNKAET
jgi:hypothetical protein